MDRFLAYFAHISLGISRRSCSRGIAEGDLLADFGVEFVGGVLGFPVAAVEIEVVAEGAVGADLFAADAGGLFGNEVPIGLLAGGGEQVLEGGADGRFVGDFVGGVGGEFFVVGSDFLVGRFEAMGEGHAGLY